VDIVTGCPSLLYGPGDRDRVFAVCWWYARGAATGAGTIQAEYDVEVRGFATKWRIAEPLQLSKDHQFNMMSHSIRGSQSEPRAVSKAPGSAHLVV
jgi:hypothetical protein